jgi:transposase
MRKGAIAGLLPGKKSDRRRTAKDNRVLVDGVLWVLRSGRSGAIRLSGMASGRACTSALTRWAKSGIWERVFAELTKDRRNEYLMLDTSLVRAPQQAATGKEGKGRALERSRGGLTKSICWPMRSADRCPGSGP